MSTIYKSIYNYLQETNYESSFNVAVPEVIFDTWGHVAHLTAYFSHVNPVFLFLY